MELAVSPETVKPVKDGLEPTAKSCGPESVIAPAALVTVTWFAVPVSVASTGTAPVSPMSSCPSVGAAVDTSVPAASA